MIGFNKFRESLSYIPGLLTLSLGIYLAIEQPHVTYITNKVHNSIELIEGKDGYNEWKNIDLFFRVWLYHLINPDKVMQGGFPVFEERGPYVYNLNLKKHVINVDETTDEMAFTVLRTYRFNKNESGSNSDDDEIVTLNAAYYGAILTMANKFPMFIGKFGNSLQKLFPDAHDIFVRAKVKDILFDGLPLVCDKEKYEDLALICSGLRGQKLPVIKETHQPDHYLYSVFGRNNMTSQGPFTVNRGVKNKYALGNITSHNGKRVTKYWSEVGCNLISGTDAIRWPPMNKKMPFVTVYEPELCRSITPYYKREEIIHGVIGYRYELDEITWADENIGCYCPMTSKKVKQCPPTGIMDATKCQGAPILISEPHFLHGDPNLIEFAQGLNPNPNIHTTSITIEPLTGTPLSGSKKLQLSLNLKPFPAITLLSNVSEGIFPLLWAEESNTATIKHMSSLIMVHKLLRVLNYFPWLLMGLGTFFTMKIWWIRGENNNQQIVEDRTIQTQRVTIHPVQRLIHHRPDNHRELEFM